MEDAHPRPEDLAPLDEELVEELARRLRRLRDYARLHVEGLEKIPEGKAVLVANHTGALGLDHALLFLTLHEELGRTFRTAVHPSFFELPLVRDLAPRLGFFEVSVTTSMQLLDHDELVLYFPEGEDGNLKPFWRYYELQPFHPGFSRVALAADAPIVPITIVGGEDANPNLGQPKWLRERAEFPVPLPLTLLPLPAKWRIKVHDPLPITRWTQGHVGDVVDVNLDEQIARDLRTHMQAGIDRELEARGNAFL